MPDPFVPLTIPPGIKNNGTTYQAKGRWNLANFVRFFQGNIQPIGGWVQRTLTGAAIVGLPSAMVAWTDNAGVPWLAVGAEGGLYVVDQNNVVYDITPGAWGTSPGLVWSLTNFGSYLVAVDYTNNISWGQGQPWVWTGDPNTPATYIAGSLSAAPMNLSAGCFMTGERFLVILSGQPPQDFPAYPVGYVA